jgi:hypothetical protein
MDHHSDAERRAAEPRRAAPPRVAVPRVGCGPVEVVDPASSMVRPSEPRARASVLAVSSTCWRTPGPVRGTPRVQYIRRFDKFSFRIASESTVSTERPDRTALGYRRFRGHACRRGCNERTGTRVDFLEYPTAVVCLAVFWRVRYKRSLRHLAAMFLQRGIGFTHEAVRA